MVRPKNERMDVIDLFCDLLGSHIKGEKFQSRDASNSASTMQLFLVENMIVFFITVARQLSSRGRISPPLCLLSYKTV
jgi:hypothetical protein